MCSIFQKKRESSREIDVGQIQGNKGNGITLKVFYFLRRRWDNVLSVAEDKRDITAIIRSNTVHLGLGGEVGLGGPR